MFHGRMWSDSQGLHFKQDDKHFADFGYAKNGFRFTSTGLTKDDWVVNGTFNR